MPRPASLDLTESNFEMAKDDLSLPDQQQQWFLRVLDTKFQQQEAIIRDLLVSAVRPDVGQPFRERRTDLSITPPFDERQIAQPKMMKIRSQTSLTKSRVSALSSSSEAKAAKTEDVAVEAASPSSASSPSGKRSRTLARVMNQNMEEDPPFKAFIKGSLDAYMGLVVAARLYQQVMFVNDMGV